MNKDTATTEIYNHSQKDAVPIDVLDKEELLGFGDSIFEREPRILFKHLTHHLIVHKPHIHLIGLLRTLESEAPGATVLDAFLKDLLELL